MVLIVVILLGLVVVPTLSISYSIVDYSQEQKFIQETRNEKLKYDDILSYYNTIQGERLINPISSWDTINSKQMVSNSSNSSNRTTFNVITAGDFGCSPRAQENIKEIELKEPELFLALGDLSYKKTLECWFEMTQNLVNKTKVAIGNHESEEELEIDNPKEFVETLLDHYNLSKTYYSFNYKNVHVLVLDTQLELSIDLLRLNRIL